MATLITKKQHKKDWLAYCQATGATDKKELFEFVQGCYDYGLWDNMVCWPLRSGQQATTGTTVHSLGGLIQMPGTLVGPCSIVADGAQQLDTAASGISVGTGFADIMNPAPRNVWDIGLVTVSGKGVVGFVNGGGGGNEIYFSIDTTAGTLDHGGWLQDKWVTEQGVPSVVGAQMSVMRRVDSTTMAIHSNGSLKRTVSNDRTIASTTALYSAAMILGNGRMLSAGDSYSGVSSFVFILPNGGYIDQLYALYKSTLGQGLALP